MKQQVMYSDLGFCEVGQRALVVPVDHPDKTLRGPWVSTSPVLSISPRINSSPVFETLNSIYRPVEDGIPIREIYEEAVRDVAVHGGGVYRAAS